MRLTSALSDVGLRLCIIRSAEAPKRRSAEAPKRRSAEAPKRRSAEAPKRRSAEAPKRRSAERRAPSAERRAPSAMSASGAPRPPLRSRPASGGRAPVTLTLQAVSARDVLSDPPLLRSLPAVALRGARPAGLCLAAALAVAALLALAAPAAAQITLYESNLVGSGGLTMVEDGSPRAQPFSTASVDGDYELTSITVTPHQNLSSTSGLTVTVREAASDGDPDGDIVATLAKPGSLTSGSDAVFDAPANTVLDANTTYYLYFDGPATMTVWIRQGGGESGGYGLSQSKRWRYFPDSASWAVSDVEIQFEIKGKAPPLKPTGLSASRAGSISDTSATLLWTAAANGGSAITDYEVRYWDERRHRGELDVQRHQPLACLHEPDPRHRLPVPGVGEERAGHRSGVERVQLLPSRPPERAAGPRCHGLQRAGRSELGCAGHGERQSGHPVPDPPQGGGVELDQREPVDQRAGRRRGPRPDDRQRFDERHRVRVRGACGELGGRRPCRHRRARHAARGAVGPDEPRRHRGPPRGEAGLERARRRRRLADHGVSGSDGWAGGQSGQCDHRPSRL